MYTGKGGGAQRGSGSFSAWSINSHFAPLYSYPARTPPKAVKREGGWDSQQITVPEIENEIELELRKHGSSERGVEKEQECIEWGPFCWQERDPWPFWGGGPSTPALAHPSSPTRGRVEDTLAEQGHPSPERGRRAQKYSLGIFKDIIFFFPGGVATWERRREGKERLPSVPRTREKLDGEKERRQLGPQLPVAWTRPCAEEERCESLPKGRAAGP